jgi:hypothetical protein
LLEMIPSSHLRVYQPLDSFPKKEEAKWAEYIRAGGQRVPTTIAYRDVPFEGVGQTGVMYPVVSDHAYVRRINGAWFVCPGRLRFRMLVSLLSFRNALPSDVADAFVPESEAEKAIDELERLRNDTPGMRANIATASWQVPIRWFVPFDDSERIVTEEESKIRIRYETELPTARSRVGRGHAIVTASGLPEPVVRALSELVDWLDEFPPESLLELDYGSVADLFDPEDLAADRSAGEVWACLEALEIGDFAESSRRYAGLVGWWARAQALETSN